MADSHHAHHGRYVGRLRNLIAIDQPEQVDSHHFVCRSWPSLVALMIDGGITPTLPTICYKSVSAST
jgi:hypothetical protein